MHYRLIRVDVSQGRDRECWVLYELPASVGRSSDLPVCLPDDSVSRTHSQLFLNAEGALCVRDLGSLNGTYVNDQKIQHCTLYSGDLLQIGAVTLRVEYTSDTHERKPAGGNQSAGGKLKPAQTGSVRPVSAAATQPLKTLPGGVLPRNPGVDQSLPNPVSARKPWWRFW